ncbi:hypothetical protein A3K86_03155 [Photobacterium jeanii]|uniref:Thiol-disulfide isomerase n=2 Tax=Photobacterium jeanii TaxID=858640 RepID=A0A178KL24_9GAMM|nr:hypothetical protein A3K86_03155 [Photobacterium jeanii]
MSLLVEVGVEQKVQVVDIAFDDDLFARYGVTIPVLSISHSDHSVSELGWPFDAAQLTSWLTRNGIN